MSEEKNILDHIKPRKVEAPDQSYFKALANEIIEKESDSGKVIPMWRKPVIWITSAAAVSALIIFSTQFSKPQNETDVLLALNEISNEEIFNYIDENIEEFDTELIASFVDENDKSISFATEPNYTDSTQVKKDPKTNDTNIIPESIDRDAILDYLEDQEINLDELSDDESFI
jgi:hypothetical protein